MLRTVPSISSPSLTRVVVAVAIAAVPSTMTAPAVTGAVAAQKLVQKSHIVLHSQLLHLACRKLPVSHLRSRRKPLLTTSRLAPTSANTAIHIVPNPISVSVRNTALTPSASVMFCTRML